MSGWCDRPGCAAPATTTFAFDGTRRILWLDRPVARGGAVAGRLCARHAARLSPPRGWTVDDRRAHAASAEPEPVATTEPAPVPATVPTSAWNVRATPGAELDEVLDARTPLLARAFRTAR